jgi:hypothetical protein
VSLIHVYSSFVQAAAFQSGRSQVDGVYGSELHCIRGIAWRDFQRWRFLTPTKRWERKGKLVFVLGSSRGVYGALKGGRAGRRIPPQILDEVDDEDTGWG